ncbi:hypothetical protein RIF29_17803 [Crotalaria pallida]|uniref:Uncharacterized protein n=1 Tax=Crotalaria pallida TaxID=3830 RepID=A0AAN9FHY4_CROPI
MILCYNHLLYKISLTDVAHFHWKTYLTRHQLDHRGLKLNPLSLCSHSLTLSLSLSLYPSIPCSTFSLYQTFIHLREIERERDSRSR